VPTREGWLFLALVVDLFSRRIVGGATAATMTSRLVADALAMAVGRRGTVAGVIAHSDRGSRYASDHFQSELRRHRMVGSMSGVGQCGDNAVIESTFGRVKKELAHRRVFTDADEAERAVFEYIEVFYNRGRLHSSLGDISPATFESQQPTHTVN
jgi:transposase InsO family protein